MPRYYDLTVTLEEAHPPVWRRLLLAADATFAELHQAIQDACGWQDSHLFEFSTFEGKPLAGLPDDEWGDWREPVPDAAATPIAPFFDAETRCRYVYDFGDDWWHTVQREGVVESDERFHRRLLDGARAFPPEDCGGIPGYEACVAVARGDDLDEVREWTDVDGLAEWMGDWHPEHFDLDVVRQAFDRVDRPSSPASYFAPRPPGFPPPSPALLSDVVVPPRAELEPLAAANPVLARLAAFVQWVGSGRKLTATGNLTRADGRELIGVLGTDDRFDEQIGERVFKTKSSVELRGVDDVFRLARKAGFVKVRKGRLTATKRGAALGKDPLADWHAAFRGLLLLGVLAQAYAHSTWMDPYWKGPVDEQVPGLLAHLALLGAPEPITALDEGLWSLVEASFVLDDLDDRMLGLHRDQFERDVRRILGAFAGLGALTIGGVEMVPTDWGSERARGGEVRTTPLGVAGVRGMVEDRLAG
jgi:hypothetical protein